jgi:tRNA(fMet)-specific endonuclease VapC
MDYLLDTNIVLIYARNNDLTQRIERKLNLLNDKNNLIVSVVTIGEVKAFAKKNQWGDSKINRMLKLLDNFLVADINIENVIERYANLDAFSQGRLANFKSNFSARNMGKNDLWIAATASTYNFILITTDKDFDHLDIHYLKLDRLNLSDF